MANYNKFWIALVGAVIAGASAYTAVDLEAQGVTPTAVMAIAVPILTALGVWATPNTPPSP